MTVKSINIKALRALVEEVPENQYVPMLKSVLVQILAEINTLRRKNRLLKKQKRSNGRNESEKVFGNSQEIMHG